MPNEQNLIPNSQRSPSELKAMTTKGGIKSGESRRRKADLRKAAQAALDGTYKLEDGRELTGEELVIQSIFANIASGKSQNYGKALEALLVLTGSKESADDKKKKKTEIELLKAQVDKVKNTEADGDGVEIVWGRLE